MLNMTDSCGGSLVALQATDTVVPGLNPASLIVENSEYRQGHYSMYSVKISGQRCKPTPEAKKSLYRVIQVNLCDAESSLIVILDKMHLITTQENSDP